MYSPTRSKSRSLDPWPFLTGVPRNYQHPFISWLEKRCLLPFPLVAHFLCFYYIFMFEALLSCLLFPLLFVFLYSSLDSFLFSFSFHQCPPKCDRCGYYFDMTSTYRPLFRGFLPFGRGPALSRSSILLALLIPVAGRVGGPLAVLVLETERIIGAGPCPGPAAGAGSGVSIPSGVAVPAGVTVAGGFRPDGDEVSDPLGGPAGPPGGALERPTSELEGGPGVAMGGRGVAAAERGAPPFGGGGVAFLAALSSGPAFLLTHRFWSGS